MARPAAPGRSADRSRRPPTEDEIVATARENPAAVAQAAFELRLPAPEFSNDVDRRAYEARMQRKQRIVEGLD